MAIIGVDYGTKTVGLSHSDPSETIAFPLQNVPLNKAIPTLLACINENNYRLIVLGRPTNMKGLPTAMTETVEAFKQQIEAVTSVPVVWVDERLTSKMASQSFALMNVNSRKSRPIKDATEAALILQGYLDNKHGKH